MPKCPKCGKETDLLIAICRTSGYQHDIVRLPVNEEEKSEAKYEPDTGLMRWLVENGSTVEDKYICPLCREEIARSIDEALKFLKGGE